MNKPRGIIFWALLLSMVVLELVGSGGGGWTLIPAFYSIFGFVLCVGLIYLAKFIGKHFIDRDLDYYDH